MGMEKCRKCGVKLKMGVNWTIYRQNKADYLCTPCRLIYQRKYQKERRHRLGITRPMGENRDCSKFLGVHVAEQVLAQVFNNVEVMPHNNKGFDFICNRRKKIDVKSSCKNKNNRWQFQIKYNTIADYFLFLAFDNRENLNPLHIWLIPGNHINHLVGTSINITRIEKWDEYRLSIDKVIKCCNIMKGD